MQELFLVVVMPLSQGGVVYLFWKCWSGLGKEFGLLNLRGDLVDVTIGILLLILWCAKYYVRLYEIWNQIVAHLLVNVLVR